MTKNMTKHTNKRNSNGAKGKTYKAVAEGVVKFGDLEARCAVLNDENETTVFTLREFEQVVGIPKQSGGKPVDKFLPTFMRPEPIKPYINRHLSLEGFSTIPFSLLRGGRGQGITVEQANKVMQGWIDAHDAKAKLTPRQRDIAELMQRMKNAASVSGFTQIIHEQLGYEDKRKRAISEVFNQIFESEAHPWEHEFPLEYYESLYKIRGKSGEWEKLLQQVSPGKKPKTPFWVGKDTKDLIYARLKPAGVLQVLEKKNPFRPGRGRENRHHQLLTKEKGIKILNRHLGVVMDMMDRHGEDWDAFYAELNARYPVQSNQMSLDFMEEKKKK